MIKTFAKIIIFILIGLLQFSLMPYLTVWGVRPNLVLVMALVLLFIDKPRDAIFAAVIGGLILDLAGNFFFGFNTLVLVVLIIATRFGREKFFSDSGILSVTILSTISLAFMNLVFMLQAKQWFSWLILIDIFYNLVFIYIVYYLFGRFWRPVSLVKIK